MLNLLYLACGLVLLFAGGEALIRGAIAAARRLGVSPLLSGLVIVGFGTSAPEMVVSVDAAMHQRPDIAIGNVVGSNICNILLILGVCAVIQPLAVKPMALRRDALSMVLATVLCMLMLIGGELGRLGAAILLAGLTAYLIWAYLTERDASTPEAQMHAAESTAVEAVPRHGLWITVMTLGGLLLLVAGSRTLLHGAVGIAQQLGLSEALIGLTLVAVGTSLPELAISAVAALRRQADVAVGNILGSNLFNILGILGVAGLARPLSIPQRILAFDQWWMLGTALVLTFFLYTSRRVSRWEGVVLLGGYVIYVTVSFMGVSG